MRSVTDFNDNWLFEGRDRVRLPHNAVDLPFSYFDETSYQRGFTYEKSVQVDSTWAGREVWLRFDAAMADARVFVDGAEVAAHRDGYTPFTARLTGLAPGEHQVRVLIDGSENPAIPPFGNVIDYLTYAGLYREVWLEMAAPLHISNVKIETPDVLAATQSLTARVHLDNPQSLPLEGERSPPNSWIPPARSFATPARPSRAMRCHLPWTACQTSRFGRCKPRHSTPCA